MSRPKATTKSAPKRTSQGTPATAPQNTAQTTAQGTPAAAPQNAAQTTVQATPAAALQGATQAVSQSAPQSMPTTAPQSAAQGAPVTAPRDAVRATPQSAAPAPTPTVEVRIDKMLDGSTKTKAFASANLFGQFAIHGLRVVETDKGRFIAMPQESYEKNGEKKYTDTFHPITAGARTMLVEAVNNAYEQKLAEQMAQFSYAAMPAQAGMGGMQA